MLPTLRPLTSDQLESICKVIWDKYKTVLRQGGKKEEEKHDRELCEACKEKTCVSGLKMPEIYHIIRELMLPPCFAIVLIKVGIKTIADFKRFFDNQVDGIERRRMEKKIKFLLRPYIESKELRSDFSLSVTIDTILSLFRPRGPVDDEDDESLEDVDENESENGQSQEEEKVDESDEGWNLV